MVAYLLVLLLEERVPITDLERILESAVTHAMRTKDAIELNELVRQDLGRSICDRFCDTQGQLRVLILKPALT